MCKNSFFAHSSGLKCKNSLPYTFSFILARYHVLFAANPFDLLRRLSNQEVCDDLDILSVDRKCP
jgi:hypothetical protein